MNNSCEIHFELHEICSVFYYRYFTNFLQNYLTLPALNFSMLLRKSKMHFYNSAMFELQYDAHTLVTF